MSLNVRKDLNSLNTSDSQQKLIYSFICSPYYTLSETLLVTVTHSNKASNIRIKNRLRFTLFNQVLIHEKLKVQTSTFVSE